MRLSIVASFVTLVSLVSSVPTSDPVSRVKARDDAQQLDALQQQALDATLTALDAEEQELQKRGQTASCTRRNLEIRLE
jgi:23S rRNA maturation mini-RNase III